MAPEPAGARRSRRRWWAGGVAAVAAAGLIGWWQLPEDSTSPAPERPSAYEYATRGFEEVSILGGARHDYPDASGVAIRRTPCGRRIVWRPLADRITSYRLCGDRLRSIHEVHRFFGRRDARTYRCEEGSSLSRGWRCTFDGATEVATGGPVARRRIDGTEAVHIRLTTRISGDVEGTGKRDFWLRRPDGFPLRLAATNDNSTGSPVGKVDYRERYELRLLPGQLRHRG